MFLEQVSIHNNLAARSSHDGLVASNIMSSGVMHVYNNTARNYPGVVCTSSCTFTASSNTVVENNGATDQLYSAMSVKMNNVTSYTMEGCLRVADNTRISGSTSDVTILPETGSILGEEMHGADYSSDMNCTV